MGRGGASLDDGHVFHQLGAWGKGRAAVVVWRRRETGKEILLVKIIVSYSLWLRGHKGKPTNSM
jgi:hypothetical protein